jgi:hypothetical protein
MSWSVGPNKRTQLSFNWERDDIKRCLSRMLNEIPVRLVSADEEERFPGLMQAHHRRGAPRKIGETIRVELLSVSATGPLEIAQRDQFLDRSSGQ